MTKIHYKVGVDVGGTNTDTVILDQNNNTIIAVKSPTTEDVQTGILNSLTKAIETSNIDKKLISFVSLGTTHATNAIIQRKGLSKTAVVRISLPAGKGVPPMSEWEDDLIKSIDAKVYMVHGGFEFDGKPLYLEDLDREECAKVLEEIKTQNFESLAVSSIFSPAKNDHEVKFAQHAKEILGDDFPVTLSSEIGSLGLLERENSAILNASVVGVARKAVQGLITSLEKMNVTSKIFFAQNDGTLMSVEQAINYPILTIGSGPTNSIRGAAYLSDEDNCIVADIGGTSTDVGILVNSFPRQSALAVEVGGVLTNFRMPDLISIGLGGGSIVKMDEDDNIQIGPESVGYQLKEKALAFGGDTLTVTDIALAAGIAQIDDEDCDVERLSNLDTDLIKEAISKIERIVLDACDKIKTSPDPLPIILVGGGNIVVPASEVLLKPENSGCANAIGAAIADASGEIDQLWSLDNKTRDEAIEEAKSVAMERAIEMGADSSDTKIVDIEAVPLSYLPGNVLRVQAKAAGSLKL
ncbi:hydantoinase/oxoprolinase N-terminal domain-containing protein [Jeotgalicoccus meleagridis]|uniref:Acetophenone carboxylase gamma subunit n=1 Tax=Jeotgalicoccus meleagridis TaxID=2759181 RepID=A0A6V7R375_9STAP|nr:hydantoinase/oxoprolinase family protein [Jeotgalicoccus meleagridis]CAD2071538.1 hypothetical protein JEODO184_00291 [Jeotgalicoccus meleagridis]